MACLESKRYLFIYKRRDGSDLYLESLNESYNIDMLGFDKGVPVVEKEHSKRSDPPPKIENTHLVKGKSVILKTNSLSGEKSLIYKQKSGENVEIPARRLSYLKTSSSSSDKNNVVEETAAIGGGAPLNSNVIRHKPTILKRKDRVRYKIITNDSDAYNTLIKERTKNNVAGNVLNSNGNGLEMQMSDSFRTAATRTNRNSTLDDHNYIKDEEIDVVENKMEPAENLEPINLSVVTLVPVTSEIEGQTRKKINSPPPSNTEKPEGSAFETNECCKSCKCNKQSSTSQDQWTQTQPEAEQPRPRPRTQTVETNTEETLLEDLIKEKCKTNNDATNLTSNSSPFGFLNDPLELNNDICDLILDTNLTNHPLLNQMLPVDSFYSFSYDELLGDGHVLDISNNNQSTTTTTETVNVNRNCGNNGNERWKVQFFFDLKHCNQFYSPGNLPLHVGVLENNLGFVKRQCLAMKIRQINVNTVNQNNMNALQLAVINDVCVDILRVLFDYGVDASVIDAEGNNLIHLAVIYSYDSIIKLLILSSPELSLNATNFEGYTPLILCVLHKKYAKAEILLSAGANPDAGDKKSGRTALFHAVEANDVEMVKLLMNYKAHTKIKNYFGTSPHDAMFELDSIDSCIRRLILAKEDVTCRSKEAKSGKRKRTSSGDSPTSDLEITYPTRGTIKRTYSRKGR